MGVALVVTSSVGAAVARVVLLALVLLLTTGGELLPLVVDVTALPPDTHAAVSDDTLVRSGSSVCSSLPYSAVIFELTDTELLLPRVAALAVPPVAGAGFELFVFVFVLTLVLLLLLLSELGGLALRRDEFSGELSGSSVFSWLGPAFGVAGFLSRTTGGVPVCRWSASLTVVCAVASLLSVGPLDSMPFSSWAAELLLLILDCA